MTVENRDVFVEATWTYSRRVTGSPVRKPAAGNERRPSLEAQSMLFGYFELKAMLGRCASGLKSWSKCIHAQGPVRHPWLSLVSMSLCDTRHPTPEERGLYRLAPFPNPQRPATQRTTPCAYDANSLPRQTLIPDSTGAASASMPRYAIVINALRPLRAGVGAILQS